MGIQGLLGALKGSMQESHLRNFAGCTVAIDALCWLHRGIYAAAGAIAKLDTTGSDKLDVGDDPAVMRAYIGFCLDRISLLRSYNVTPYMVFDGSRLPAKEVTEKDRAGKRRSAIQTARDFKRAGKHDLALMEYVKSVDVTPKMCYRLIQELKKQSIQYVVAPYEADAQLAYLCQIGVANAVITEDSDTIPYGVARVLFKMTKDGSGDEWRRQWLGSSTEVFRPGATSADDTHLIRRANKVQLQQLHRYDAEKLQLMCVLAGCDYCPSLPGIGVKKANSLVNSYATNWKLMLRQLPLRMKIVVPSTYEPMFERALLTFRHQRVYDPKLQRVVSLSPLPETFWKPHETRIQEKHGKNAIDLLKHGYFFPKEEQDKLNFLGPIVEPEIARGIAEGILDPNSHRPYETLYPNPVNYSPRTFMSPTGKRPSTPFNSSNKMFKARKGTLDTWTSNRKSSDTKGTIHHRGEPGSTKETIKHRGGSINTKGTINHRGGSINTKGTIHAFMSPTPSSSHHVRQVQQTTYRPELGLSHAAISSTKSRFFTPNVVQDKRQNIPQTTDPRRTSTGTPTSLRKSRYGASSSQDTLPSVSYNSQRISTGHETFSDPSNSNRSNNKTSSMLHKRPAWARNVGDDFIPLHRRVEKAFARPIQTTGINSNPSNLTPTNSMQSSGGFNSTQHSTDGFEYSPDRLETINPGVKQAKYNYHDTVSKGKLSEDTKQVAKRLFSSFAFSGDTLYDNKPYNTDTTYSPTVVSPRENLKNDENVEPIVE